MDNDQMNDNRNEDTSPVHKKARMGPKSVELDLEIVVGKDSSNSDNSNDSSIRNDSNKDKDGEKKQMCESRWYSSAVMATFSGYIDAMMASSMKESDTKRITFPDIDICTWDLMMKYVFDPSAVLENGAVEEMVQVVTFFEKYDFEQATTLCDKKLLQYLNEINMESPENMDLFVAVIRVSQQVNLNESFTKAKFLLNQVFGYHEADDRVFHPSKFTKNQVCALVPFLLVLNGTTEVTPLGEIPNETIENSLFPELFVNQWLHQYRRVEVTAIRVTGTTMHQVNTIYERSEEWHSDFCYIRGHESFEFAGLDQAEYRINIHDHDGEWQIVLEDISGEEDDDVILWVAPGSAHFPVPPRDGWVSIHHKAKGTPRVTAHDS